LGVAEDGRAKAEEGLVEDEGGREELMLEVDLGENVVEAAKGMAEEGARWFGAEVISGPHVEDDGGDPRTALCQGGAR
jgi:hypothetical protein